MPTNTQRKMLEPFKKAIVADKSSCTREEDAVLESPMTAGMAITAADPSGLSGLLTESLAEISKAGHP